MLCATRAIPLANKAAISFSVIFPISSSLPCKFLHDGGPELLSNGSIQDPIERNALPGCLDSQLCTSKWETRGHTRSDCCLGSKPEHLSTVNERPSMVSSQFLHHCLPIPEISFCQLSVYRDS